MAKIIPLNAVSIPRHQVQNDLQYFQVKTNVQLTYRTSRVLNVIS